MIFFLFIGFLRGRVLLSSCLCYNVCRGDGDLRMGGIRASVSYATPPYAGGVVRLLLLIFTASPLLPILVVPLFLIAPPFYTIGGAISFCLLIITIYPPRACLSRLGFADRYGCCCVMPSSYPCGCLAVFCGFHTGPLACPSRRASSVLPLHGTPLVMSSFKSPRSSSRSTASHRLSPRSSTR